MSGVWVWIEQFDGQMKAISQDMLGAGRTAAGAQQSLNAGLQVACIPTDPAGNYDLVVSEGTYDVSVEMARYLDAERVNVSVTTGLTLLPPVTLLGGDAIEDDVINILDLALLGGRYLVSCGEATYDPRADINDDCVINILDLSITGGNFLLSSPVPW